MLWSKANLLAWVDCRGLSSTGALCDSQHRDADISKNTHLSILVTSAKLGVKEKEKCGSVKEGSVKKTATFSDRQTGTSGLCPINCMTHRPTETKQTTRVKYFVFDREMYKPEKSTYLKRKYTCYVDRVRKLRLAFTCIQRDSKDCGPSSKLHSYKDSNLGVHRSRWRSLYQQYSFLP